MWLELQGIKRVTQRLGQKRIVLVQAFLLATGSCALIMDRQCRTSCSSCVMQSIWACVLMALVGFTLALNRERFPKLEIGFSVAMLTYPIVAIPGRTSASQGLPLSSP